MAAGTSALLTARAPTPYTQTALTGTPQQGRTDCRRLAVQRSATDEDETEGRPDLAVPRPGTREEAGTHAHPSVHSRALYNTPDPGTAQAPISGRREREDAPAQPDSAAERHAPLPQRRGRVWSTFCLAKSGRERQTLCGLAYARNLTNDADERTCKAEADLQTENTPVASEGEKREGENRGYGTNIRTTTHKVDQRQGYSAAQEVTAFTL